VRLTRLRRDFVSERTRANSIWVFFEPTDCIEPDPRIRLSFHAFPAQLTRNSVEYLSKEEANSG
jgi:hypothetical protein